MAVGPDYSAWPSALAPPTLVVLLSALFLGVPLTRKIVLVLLVSQVHALFLHEPLNLLQLAGAALVILSVMYLTDRKRAIVPS